MNEILEKASVNPILGKLLENAEEELEEGLNEFFGLLALDDEHFKALAPLVLEEVEKNLKVEDYRIFISNVLAEEKITHKDIAELIVELEKVLSTEESLDFSESKKDFLKAFFNLILNSISENLGAVSKVVNVAFEKIVPEVKMPTYAHLTDSGMDVYALEDYTIKPGETVLIPTGFKVAIPEGYEIQVRPKSGRSLKSKLRVANTPGTIDAGYRDEVGIIIENIANPIEDITYEVGKENELKITSVLYGASCFIGKGEKVAQLVLCEVPKINFYEVSDVTLIGNNREGGFGSTTLK